MRANKMVELNTSSMADIAFLLLTFFLMTTVIKNEKGLMMMLPQWSDIKMTSELKERNIFSIQLNAENGFLVEGERRNSLINLRHELKKFILNQGADNNLSESPAKAVISLKTDRNTSHAAFIYALDEIHAAYFEIYAARAKLKVKQFRELDLNDKEDRKIYDNAREGIPMNISIAEPTKIN